MSQQATENMEQILLLLPGCDILLLLTGNQINYIIHWYSSTPTATIQTTQK